MYQQSYRGSGTDAPGSANLFERRRKILYEEYVNVLGETPLTLNGAKRALSNNRFAKVEDPDKNMA